MGGYQEAPREIVAPDGGFKPGDIVITDHDILARIDEVASQIAPLYPDNGRNLMVVGVMSGGFMAGPELAKALYRHGLIELQWATVKTEGYGASHEIDQEPRLIQDISLNPHGKDVLYADDIGDTGLTQRFLKKLADSRGASSVRFFTIFGKPARRIVDIDIDFVGFNVPDQFLVGHGMGDGELGRANPDVTVAPPR